MAVRFVGDASNREPGAARLCPPIPRAPLDTPPEEGGYERRFPFVPSRHGPFDCAQDRLLTRRIEAPVELAAKAGAAELGVEEQQTRREHCLGLSLHRAPVRWRR